MDELPAGGVQAARCFGAAGRMELPFAGMMKAAGGAGPGGARAPGGAG